MSPPFENRALGPVPATGAWRPGDPLGGRRFHTVADQRWFRLEGGGGLRHVEIAYETWGELNQDASNAVLVCHALTGDSHAAGGISDGHPTPGWWDGLIGPGRCLDTDRYFVVCANVLGGCQGSTGPASLDPETSKPYGSRFPVVTVRDWVRTQASLADGLGIQRWAAVLGGSMGGMQALEWAIMYPDRVDAVVVACSTAAASPQQIAWSHIGRSAITADPRFRGGDYYDAAPGDGPHRGLEVARMTAQVTYRSDRLLDEQFGRETFRPVAFDTDPMFQVESYLDYHGDKLVRRFDANSYLLLNRAMDLHDIGRGRGGVDAALARIRARVLVASVDTDGLYVPAQQERLHRGLLEAGRDSCLLTIRSDHGHDGFLTEMVQLTDGIGPFLDQRPQR